MFPQPLDDAVKRVWAYASNYARHGAESKQPTMAEAELVFGLCVSLINYLAHLLPENTTDS